MEVRPEVVKKDLLTTLDVIKVAEMPALIEEVMHFFVSENGGQINNNLIATELRELEGQGKVFTNDEGFVALSNNLAELIKKRASFEELTRERAKYAQKVLNGISGLSFIKFVGAIGDAPLGRLYGNEKIKLVLVAEKDTAHVAKFLLEMYLKLRFALKNFEIAHIHETDNLRWPRIEARDGIKLLNMLSFINKDKAYENFMATNNWIFEIFTNYPLGKVSWGFRVSKNDTAKVSGFIKSLNKFLAPK